MSDLTALLILGNYAFLGLVFLLGICAGSFFNVCIYRLPRKMPIIFARSQCPFCRQVLTFFDLVPLISYFLRRGKCRYCRKPISARYPLVEFLSGGLFLLCYLKFQLSLEFFAAIIFAAFLLVIAFIDIDCRLIYDEILVCLGSLGILFHVFLNEESWPVLLSAAALGGGFLLLIIFLSRGKMGLGDAKMAGVLGVWLGAKVVPALFLAFISGAFIGLFLILSRRKTRKDFIAFAPFLSLGAFLSLLYGAEIINWYLDFFNFR